MNFRLSKNIQILLVGLSLLVMSFYAGGIFKELEMYRSGGIGSGNLAGAPSQPNAPAPSAPNTVEDLDPITDADHVRGNRNAPIALIEYSDYECPFCQQFHPTAQQVVDEYGGDVMWVYRHFPLESIHPTARPAAIAAECVAQAGGNDAFWAYTDVLFGGEALSNEFLVTAASNLGLDITSCFENGDTNDLVSAGLDSGTRAGITGTPGNILLNTETGETVLIPGALPFAQVSEAIDSIL